MNELEKNIVQAIKSVIGDKKHSLHEPIFNGNEWIYLKDCLDSTYVSSVGNYVTNFEKNISDFVGSKYAVAVSSGTAALHLALHVAGISKNDEVLLPALTFVATANAITYCNAIPHFVDSDEETFGVDSNKLIEYLDENTKQRDGQCINLKTGRVIKALIPVHIFGHPCQIDELIELCAKYNLKLIEDAAEGIGSYYKGQHVGTFGISGVISFNGNKTITTGGGGVLITNDYETAKMAKHLSTTAKMPHEWEYEHDEIGFNYRMPNINAALGCSQLEQISKLLQFKRTLFNRYKTEFDKYTGFSIKEEPKNCKSNYWLQTLLLDNPDKSVLKKLLITTNQNNISTRPVWNLLNKLKPFQNNPCMELNNSEKLSKRIINIPSNVVL